MYCFNPELTLSAHHHDQGMQYRGQFVSQDGIQASDKISQIKKLEELMERGNKAQATFLGKSFSNIFFFLEYYVPCLDFDFLI